MIKTLCNLIKNEVINKIGYRQKPLSLQMPITSKCNSRCVTCNIWKHKTQIDIDIEKLARILSNDYFSEVRNIGINGGEPTLHHDFIGLVQVLLALPKLKGLYLISNCINSAKLLNLLETIYPLCKEKNVSLNLQISLDGIYEIHDNVRGIPNSFTRTMSVINTLYNNKQRYLDNFNIGCTISKDNVDYLTQIEEYLSQYDIPVYFHLAVPNKRIYNFNDAPFSVLRNEHSAQMAAEFFYKKFDTAKTRGESCRYFLLYLYLTGKCKKRLFECEYLYRDVTINEELDTFLCATASDTVGNLGMVNPSFELYNSKAKETKSHCNECIHYANEPNLRGIIIFYMFKIKFFRWTKLYKMLCK